MYRSRRKTLCILFGALFSPGSVAIGIELAQKYRSSILVWILIMVSLYVILVSSPWWIYYAGKPKGIRYGHISGKKLVRSGKYSGYKYNIYFEDIHKSITQVYISNVVPKNEYKEICLKDSVKVVKCWSGLLIFMR